MCRSAERIPFLVVALLTLLLSSVPAHRVALAQTTDAVPQSVPPTPQAAPASPDAGENSGEAFRSTSPVFIKNEGQFAEPVRFKMWGGPGEMFLTDDAIWFVLSEKPEKEAEPGLRSDHPQKAQSSEDTRQAVALKVTFPGSNPHPDIEPFDRLEMSANYFIGNDPAKWRTHVSVYGGVRYKDLYPGVSLEIAGVGGRWQWKMERGAACASALSEVKMRVDGAEGVKVSDGILRVRTAVGKFALPLLSMENIMPVIRGKASLKKVERSSFVVAFPFSLAQGRIAAGATATASDLDYSTFLGGSHDDEIWSIAVDGTGHAYVTGSTSSVDFPTTSGAFDRSFGSGDAFVVQLSTDGHNLLYSTFLGGDHEDDGLGIAVDESGNAYVTGYTVSGDFPTTPNAFDRSYNGGVDAFVAKLSSDGSNLIYSTFLGGNHWDDGRSIAVDKSGCTYVVGGTSSDDFPTTPDAFSRSYGGGGDAFVAKLSADGDSLIYSAFLGGGHEDDGLDISVDANENIYVTGYTYSDDFPTTSGAFCRSYNGEGDAFATRLSPDGGTLIYSTFLGGSNDDDAYGIAVDGSGHAYVTGRTSSSDFPTTSGTIDQSLNGGVDAFVAELSSDGNSLIYSTFLGGSNDDDSYGITVDENGDAYVTGRTHSSDFPVTSGAFDRSYNGGADVFVAKLSAGGRSLTYSTFLGGGGDDRGYGVAVDENKHAYVVGYTCSSDFPTTPSAFDQGFAGGKDAFIARLALTPAVTFSFAFIPLSLKSMPKCDIYEPNDEPALAWGPLASGVGYRARMCDYDEDYYYFEPARAGSMSLHLQAPASLVGNVAIWVYYNGSPVGSCGSAPVSTGDFHVTCNLQGTGRYLVRLYLVDPSHGDDRHEYMLRVDYPH